VLAQPAENTTAAAAAITKPTLVKLFISRFPLS
jgi:hypothetical protein